MTVIIHHDKETWSEADLKACGAYAYSLHPSTDCLLTSGVVEHPNGERTGVHRWRPGMSYPYADIHPDDIEIHAWNSQFERLIWNNVMVPRYSWPRLALEQFVCISAQARMMAAGPAKLEKAAPFYGLAVRKDNAGHQLMLKMCRPATEAQQLKYVMSLPNYELCTQEGYQWARDIAFERAKRCHHTERDLDRLHDYCDQDVWTEIGIADILPPWHPDDLEAFWENERINDEGIIVDLEFAREATQYAGEEAAYFSQELALLTGGKIDKVTQAARLSKWFAHLMSDAALDVATWYDNGQKKLSFDADTRGNLLAQASADLDWLAYAPDHETTFHAGTPDEFTLSDGELIAEVLELREAASKSAIGKYQAMINRAVQGPDGLWRVHGCYILAGASQSTRFSSTGIQMHNLVRDVPKNTKALMSAFKRADEPAIRGECEVWASAHNARLADTQRPVKPEPIHVLARLVRPTIMADPSGRFDFAWCDWSSIELCTNPWLSLEPSADALLAMLRAGEDIYLKTASDITGRTITKEDEFERQAFGKVPNLSLGYLGGAGAFKAMAKAYGVRLDDATVRRVVSAWREANPWAARFGRAAEIAAMRALERPGETFHAGRLAYLYLPDDLGGLGALLCILPSGKELCYPDPRIELVTTSYGKVQPCVTARKAAWSPKKDAKDWPRVAVWQGLLIENAAQAVATGELLRLGLARCRAEGLIVVAHTHDEIMIRTPDPMRDGPRLMRLMTQAPDWPGAETLPLRAEWGAGFRYKVKENYA